MKKKIYISLVMLLMIMIFMTLYEVLDFFYFEKNQYLNLFMKFAFLFLGHISGYFLGQTWWRIVYVEKRHWINGKNNIFSKTKK